MPSATFSPRLSSFVVVDSRKGESLCAGLGSIIVGVDAGLLHNPVEEVVTGLLHKPLERGAAALALLCNPLPVLLPASLGSGVRLPVAAVKDEPVEAKVADR